MPLSEINGVGNTKKKTVNETPEEETRNVVEIEKNIICPTNLPVQKRRGKKEVEIRRNINCQNPLVLSLSLRRRKKKHYCLTTSPEANKKDLKIVLVRIPLNKNSCYALQSRAGTLLIETLLHLAFTIFNAMMKMSAKSLERKSGVF